MDFEEIKKGQKIIESILAHVIKEKGFVVNSYEWLPINMDQMKTSLQIEYNGKHKRLTFSRESIEDCVNDTTERDKIQAYIAYCLLR